MFCAQGNAVGLGATPPKRKMLPVKARLPEGCAQGLTIDHTGRHQQQDVEAGRPVTHTHYVDGQADIDAGPPVTH